MVRNHPEWTVFNRGVNGERTDAILARWSVDVLAEHPDYVVILAGVNDVYQGRSDEEIEGNLGALYRGSIDSGIQVVALSILPYNSISSGKLETMRSVNGWIQQRAASDGFRFFDAHRLLSDPTRPGRLTSSDDGLRPDVAGYQSLGEALATVLEEEESSPRSTPP
jgi:lysophospholipase L1-like esterase